jgi:NAD(P)-dependent dehydrogenase (short-subunit alcohol dehydrogenase family)
MTLQGSSAIVTGGAVGLGRTFAAALAREGARVTICDVRSDVELTAAELRGQGLQVEAVIADVSQPVDVRHVVDGVGTVDVLVSNAGVVRATEPTDDWEKALDDYDAVIGTNLKGTYLFGRAVAPLMAEQGSGNIINIATDHTHTCGWPDPVDHADSASCPWAGERRRPGFVGMDLYDASKWGLNGLTQNWARSLRQHGVRVNNICMGATDSHMMRAYFGVPEGEEPPPEVLAKWMSADDVARVLIELIEEGPEGRSGDNIGLWIGHPTTLPPPSPLLNIEPGVTPETITAPLTAYYS